MLYVLEKLQLNEGETSAVCKDTYSRSHDASAAVVAISSRGSLQNKDRNMTV